MEIQRRRTKKDFQSQLESNDNDRNGLPFNEIFGLAKVRFLPSNHKSDNFVTFVSARKIGEEEQGEVEQDQQEAVRSIEESIGRQFQTRRWSG